MKRFIALLLAAMMLLAFVACDNSNTPAGGTDAQTNDNAGTNAPAGTENKGDDKTPADEYTPDPDCPYSGSVGVGATGGTAYFDDLRVRNRGKGPADLIASVNFEDETKLPTFHALGATDEVKGEVVADPTLPEGSSLERHVLSVGTGATLVTGEPIWNLYQLTVKVFVPDEKTVADVYFCVVDANNYYVLSLGENDNSEITCYVVKDGKKENAQFTVKRPLPTDALTSVGITLNNDTIEIYVGGEKILHLYNEEFDLYHGHVPASLEATPAPEGLTYFAVDSSNIIHDGKGTWENHEDTTALMAFDGNKDSYYDCDEKNEGQPPTEAVLVGSEYGDYTDPENLYGYCGGHFETAFVLKQIRLYPRDTFASSKTDGSDRYIGCTIQASNDGKEWVTLYTLETAPTEGQFTIVDLENTTAYTYYRYYSRAESYCNVNELEFWGTAA